MSDDGYPLASWTRWPWWVLAPAFGLVYLLALQVSLFFMLEPAGIAPFWLQSGLSYGALLVASRSLWPALLAAVFVANVIGDLLAGYSLAVTAGFAAANTLEPALAAVLAQALLGHRGVDFRTPSHVLAALIAAPALACAAAAVLGAGSIALGQGSAFWSTAALWLTDDWVGILVVAPVVVTWCQPPAGGPVVRARRGTETAAWYAVMLAVTALIFAVARWGELNFGAGYLLFPAVIWGGLRLPIRHVAAGVAAVALLLVTLTALWPEYMGSAETPLRAAIAIQLLVGTAGLVALVLAAAEQRRSSADQELRLTDAALRNAADGVVITDRDGGIVSANGAFERITGYTGEALTGHPLHTLRQSPEGEPNPEIRRALAADGQWRGELSLRRSTDEPFPALVSITSLGDAAGEPSHYVAVFSDLSTYRDYEQRLDYLTYHDDLSHAYNRPGLAAAAETALERARRSGREAALLAVGLDGFKRVNESLGRAAGDRILAEMAGRLQGLVPAGGSVARLSGDEFGVLLAELPRSAEADRWAREVLAALGEPCTTAGHDVRLGASVGISCFPGDASDTAELMEHADIAMNRAKQQGGGRHLFFDDAMNREAYETFALVQALRQAVEKERLSVVYQPVIDLDDGRLVGFEALARWHDPGLGEVAPSRFIPLAEEHGLIQGIDYWVLRRCCEQIRTWRGAGDRGFYVAVNVSARTFGEAADLPGTLEKVLHDTGVPPGALELEITETAAMPDPERSLRTIAALREIGVGVALDDFGTGYSSLSYLRRFPITRLKIDGAFVRGLPEDTDNAELVRSMLAMARQLDLPVVGECIESEAQWQFLRSAGCRYGQGFGIGYPEPPEALGEVIA